MKTLSASFKTGLAGLFLLFVLVAWIGLTVNKQLDSARQTMTTAHITLTQNAQQHTNQVTQIARQSADLTAVPLQTTRMAAAQATSQAQLAQPTTTMPDTPPPTSLPSLPPDETSPALTEAKYQAALARQLAAQAALLRLQVPNGLQTSALLATESLLRFPNSQADETIRYALRLLPHPVAVFTDTGSLPPNQFLRNVTFSPDGRYLGAAGSTAAYLWRITDGQEEARIPHSSPVGELLFSPNGQYVVSQSIGEIKVWRAETGEIIDEIPYSGGVNALVISPDSHFLAAAGSDRLVQVWQINDVGLNREVQIQPGAETAQMAFTPDSQYLLTLTQQEYEGGESALWVWQAQTGVEVKQWETAVAPPFAFTISPDGRYLATTDSRTTQVWDFASGAEVARLPLTVGAMAFQPGGELLAFSGTAGVQVWPFTLPDGEVTTITEEGVSGITFSPDGQLLAAVSGLLNNESVVHVWPVMGGEELARITHANGVWDVAFSPDGHYLASTGGDGTAVLWEIAPWNGLYTDLGVAGYIDSAIFSADGQLAAVASQNGEIVLWSLLSQQALIRMTGDNGGGVSKLLFSPDQQYLALAWSDSLHLFDVTTATEIGPFSYPTGEEYYLRDIAFSSDSRYLATASYDQTVRLWDVASGQQVAQYLLGGPGTAVAFTPDNQTMITAQLDGLIQLWDLNTSLPTRQFSISGGALGPAVFVSPDGTLLAAYAEGQAMVWDLNSQELLLQVGDTVESPYFYAALFSPDSRYFVTSGNDGTIRIWDISAQQEAYRWSLPTLARQLSISQDGRYLVAQAERVTHIWDMISAQEVAVVPHFYNAMTAALSPDNRLLLTGSQIWLWQPTDMLLALCDRVVHNLTPADWQTYLGDEPYRQLCQTLP